jgi:peptidoglycan/xylan/chitin deacetylase (PgdA/CDA1 family)
MSRGEHHRDGGCQGCRDYAPLGRRSFLGLLGLGVASLLGACADSAAGARLTSAGPAGGLGETSGAMAPPDEGMPAGSPDNGYTSVDGTLASGSPPTTAVSAVQLDNFPEPNPGPPVTFTQGPKSANQIAITIDDGYCAGCVASYVSFAQSSGIHITFSPNGVYSDLWKPYATTLRSLIESGQVQIGNHTFNHLDVTKLSDSRFKSELEKNEDWIQKTFGITSRPWYRPPFGRHNKHTDGVAGELGFTNILMWNGSFGDAALLTPKVLMAQAYAYLRPGTIMLGHANHPTVTHLFPQIQEVIVQRKLEPVTLDEMFGTSRATG